MPLFTTPLDEPRWHHTARAAFTVLFFLVWLEAVSCFVFFMILSKNGSPVPTLELSASVFNHGHVFYVAPSQKHLYDATHHYEIRHPWHDARRIPSPLRRWRQNLLQPLAT